MRKYIISISLSLVSITLLAQNSVDALRYSRLDYTGSARFTAMGGSFGALGGEASALTINPAGIGVYRNSEFTASIGFNDYSLSTRYRGSEKSDGRINFNLPNLAYVGSYKGDPNGWKNYSFALSYNRINNFNSETRLYGNSNNSTIIDDYVNILNNDNANEADVENYAYPFGPSQAWQLILIDTLTNQNTGQVDYIPYIYLDEFLNTGISVENIEQERRIETKGGQSETQFAFGGNYQDRLYLGASIGFQRIRFEQDYLFREFYTYSPPQQAAGSGLKITSYEESSNLEIKGTGVNLKVGIIYKLTEQLRVGAAIHSPTFFGLNEVYLFDASAMSLAGESFRADSITSNFEYRVSTPARYNLSLAYIVGRNAAINVDYEYVDYTTAKFNDKSDFDFDFSTQNTQIENTLNAAHNIRVGAEYKFNPFVVRAGYNFEANPYNNSSLDFDDSRNTYSIGGGFRNKNFNFDVALNLRQLNSIERVYTSSDVNATIDETERNLMFTVGWKW